MITTPRARNSVADSVNEHAQLCASKTYSKKFSDRIFSDVKISLGPLTGLGANPSAHASSTAAADHRLDRNNARDQRRRDERQQSTIRLISTSVSEGDLRLHFQLPPPESD